LAASLGRGDGGDRRSGAPPRPAPGALASRRFERHRRGPAANRPLYRPEDIRSATLVVTGEWGALTPRASALSLFDSLTSARAKRDVEIGGATHFAHLERNRLQLFEVVQNFLEEA
jgi:pimeloyl-ACP methyl ester carboxylesterase